MARPAIISALLLVVAIACHQQVATEGAAPVGRSNVITRDQIDSTGYGNAYDVIARLHPEFLRDRGTVSINLNMHDRAVAFLNEQEYGIPETLRNFSALDVEEIRYFSGTQAVIKFGAQYGGGVIQLISRIP